MNSFLISHIDLSQDAIFFVLNIKNFLSWIIQPRFETNSGSFQTAILTRNNNGTETFTSLNAHFNAHPIKLELINIVIDALNDLAQPLSAQIVGHVEIDNLFNLF